MLLPTIPPANTAAAWDVDPLYLISNTGEALVRVEMDPIFDLGTIIGKVFEDNNGNEIQDRGERGIADAMVVLDNGTYVLTDQYGRYHIPGIRPGHRMLKINRRSLPAGTRVRGEESRIVSVTPGLLVKVNFQVAQDLTVETIGRPGDMGLTLNSQDRMEPVEVTGSTGALQVMVNGVNANLPQSDVVLGVLSAVGHRRGRGGSASNPEPCTNAGNGGPHEAEEPRGARDSENGPG